MYFPYKDSVTLKNIWHIFNDYKLLNNTLIFGILDIANICTATTLIVKYNKVCTKYNDNNKQIVNDNSSYSPFQSSPNN